MGASCVDASYEPLSLSHSHMLHSLLTVSKVCLSVCLPVVSGVKKNRDKREEEKQCEQTSVRNFNEIWCELCLWDGGWDKLEVVHL